MARQSRDLLSIIIAALSILTPAVYIFWLYHALRLNIQDGSQDSVILVPFAWLMIIQTTVITMICMAYPGGASLQSKSLVMGKLLHSWSARQALRKDKLVHLRKDILRILKQDYSCDANNGSVQSNFTLTFGGLFPVTYSACVTYFIEVFMISLLFYRIYSF